MVADEGPNCAVARRLLAAIGEHDLGSFAQLLDPEVEIHTQRGVKRGSEQATRWAGRRFDHLERRYEVDELHEAGDTVVALARVQYVWRESGQIGGEWLLGLALEFREGRLLRWRLFDDPMEALEELER